LVVGTATFTAREVMVATNYEVRSGRRAVALRDASTAHEALMEYLRGLGCRDSEVVRMGDDRAAWRGAVYSAVPAAGDDS
jgi:hypothetical protein